MKRSILSLIVVVFVSLASSAQEAHAWGWRWGWGSRYYSNYGCGCNRYYYPSYYYGSNSYGCCSNYGSYANYGYGMYPNYATMYGNSMYGNAMYGGYGLGNYGFGNYGAGLPGANLLSMLTAGGTGLSSAQASYISVPMGSGYGQPSYLQVPVGGVAGRPSYLQVPVSTGFGPPVYMQIQLGPTTVNNGPAPSPSTAPAVGALPQGDSLTTESKRTKYSMLDVASRQPTILRHHDSADVNSSDAEPAQAPTRLVHYTTTNTEREIAREDASAAAWSPLHLPTYSELHAQTLSRRKASPPSEAAQAIDVASSEVEAQE
jgi:hypothetical protein